MTPPDYEAAIATAAFFDDSATGKLILRGPDAPMFLGNLSTNDIAQVVALERFHWRFADVVKRDVKLNAT